MSTDPTRPAGEGPIDEVGFDLGPDEARGLLDGWLGTGGGTGDRSGEKTGAVGTDQDAAHARLAALSEAEALLREIQLPDCGRQADWLLRTAPDPLPLADGLPSPSLPPVPDGISEVTAVGQHPFWASGGPAPEGRPTDSGFVNLDDRTDALGGAGRTHPGVDTEPPRGTDAGFTDPSERTLTRVTVRGASPAGGPSSSPPAWLLVVLGALVVLLSGAVVYLLLGR